MNKNQTTDKHLSLPPDGGYTTSTDYVRTTAIQMPAPTTPSKQCRR